MADAFMRKLSTPKYNPEQYVRELSLTSEGLTDLASARQKIQTCAEETNGLLKKNVYKNYTQFIETAKEISYLESEMYQLSHLLTEQKLLLASLLEISLSGSKGSPTKDKDIEPKEEEMKKNLTSLLEKVEGCASIMELPGRYLVYNGNLTELDPVSLQQIQRVHAFLLNDSLMLASWLPNRHGPVRYKFLALYELENLAVVNVRDVGMLKHSFKLLMFPDTRLFACSSAKAKKEWLSALENTKKAKINAESQKRETLLEKSKEEIQESTNPFLEDGEEGFPEYEEQPDWFVELPEDLDVCIAQRDFEEAVNLIARGNEYFHTISGTHMLKEMRARIDQRIKQLTEVLMNELKVTPDKSLQGGPRAARRAVSVLIKLGKSAQACDLFLKHRSAILKYNTKQLKIEGVTTLYIKRLCTVYFSHMMDTSKEFVQAFPEHHGCYSALIVWATSELKNFANIFSRQVFTPQVAISTVAECVSQACTSCDQMKESGLDLAFMLNSLLRIQVERTILDTREKLLEAIKLRAQEDKWRPLNLQNKAGLQKFSDDVNELGITTIHTFVYDDCWVALSSTTISFSKAYLNFLDDVLKLHTEESSTVIVDTLVELFQAQLKHIWNSLTNEKFKNEVKFIQKNAQFLLDTILVLAERRYEEKIKRPCHSLSNLRKESQRFGISNLPIPKHSSPAFV